MPCLVHLITGPPQSGKTAQLLDRFRRFLTAGPPGAVLWLAPTWRAAAALRQRLLQSGTRACFSPGVMTFELFADSLLANMATPIRPLTGPMKRQIIRAIVDELHDAGKLQHFGPIAGRRGLVDMLVEFIADLKRVEIWPEHLAAACQARGTTFKDEELLAVYGRYQEHLLRHGLYDAEGRFWLARDWLQKDFAPGETSLPFAPRKSQNVAEQTTINAATFAERKATVWPRGLKFVAVDGFTDFTRTQHEILEILASRVEELCVTLTLESRPCREELFAKPLKTLAELQRRHAGTTVDALPRPAARRPALAHLEQRLFCSPRETRDAPSTAGLTIIAAARPLGEMQAIAARIKRLLASGAATPDDIAVVFRTPQTADSLVGEVFGAFGLPAAYESGPTLDRCPALRALRRLLELVVDDWPAASLRAWVRNSYFQPDWAEWDGGRAAIDVERAVRRAQIVGGRRALLESLAATVARAAARAVEAADHEGEDDASADDAGAAPRALALLERLAAALDALPQRATRADWAVAWRIVAAEVGLLRTIDQPVPAVEPLPVNERQAWARLEAALEQSGHLDRWLRRDAQTLDLPAALEELRDLLATERLAPGGDQSGHVRVLSAASLRALNVKHLFIAGLAEKAFPQPDRDNNVYSGQEVDGLVERGLPLSARSDRSRDEMLLFYETVTRATEQLYLSYPSLDESAQPLSPSPFVKEVGSACGATPIETDEQVDLRPVPAGDEPLSSDAWRVLATAQALDGKPALLAGLVNASPLSRKRERGADLPVGLGPAILAGLRQVELRSERAQFGPAEGVILGQAARREIAKRFSPERTFTATELEAYAACPYRFLIERVLKIKPLEDIELQADFLYRGGLAHEVLAAFHRTVNERLGRPGSPLELGEEECQQIMDEAFAAAARPRPRGAAQAALREADLRTVRRWLGEYRQQYEEYEKAWQKHGCRPTPALFEVGFADSRSTAAASVEQPLEITFGEETVRLSGRVDRVDWSIVDGTTLVTIVDYKIGAAGHFSDEHLAAGLSLQLPIYAMATCELLLADRDALPLEAGYWRLRDGGFKFRSALKMYDLNDGEPQLNEEWESRRACLDEVIVSLVRGLRRGEFPVYNADEQCTSICQLKTACRIGALRALEKKWQPSLDETDAAR